MTAKPVRLSELFRTRPAGGAPLEFMLDSWAQAEDAILADSGRALTDIASASDALPALAGAIADRHALAVAVMNVRGELYFADAAYRALFPDSADLRLLLRRAAREGQVVSLVEGAAGLAFIAWIGASAAAARWPLDDDAAAALGAGADRLAVVVSAPSRSSELARRAARALDLTALEARLAEALMFAPSLEAAASIAGVGRETARDALRRINAKAGVRRTPELIARLISLMCEVQGGAADNLDVARTAFGLTPAEARAAAFVAGGGSAPEAAQALGVSPETIRSHVKSALAKTGAKGIKDLARLWVEARELVAMADAAEPMLGGEPEGGRLRIVASLDGARHIALIDYGPYDGDPVLVFHGAAAGRRLPRALRDGMIAAGLRPIVIQRPGFGLTDPATGDYAATGAADMAAAIERLRLRRVRMLARDTGIPVALAFARSHPELLGHSVLLNPHGPVSASDVRDTFAASVQRNLLSNPDLVTAFAEFLRRQATTRLLDRILDRAFSELEPDSVALKDPDVRTFLIRDIQALCARSARGFAAEHGTYAHGWTPPPGLVEGAGWTVAVSGGLPPSPDDIWSALPGRRVVRLEGAGLLLQFTHPQALVALMTGGPA